MAEAVRVDGAVKNTTEQWADDIRRTRRLLGRRRQGE